MTASRGRTLGATLESKRQHKDKLEAAPQQPPGRAALAWVGRIACLLIVALFPWFRGGVDYWSQVWIGGLLLVGLGVWCVEAILDRKSPARGLPLVVIPVLLGVLLALVQLIPLPDYAADLIAPRQKQLIASFASPAGMAESPPAPLTRLTLDVTTGKAQLAILCFALAGLILGIHFFKSSAHTICFFVVVAGSAAAVSIVGILQRVTFSGRTLLPNETVSGVLPFAFFVNRNNAACYLLIGFAAAVGLLYWNLFREIPNRKPRPIISREIPVWRQIQQNVGIFIAELTPSRVACLLLVLMIGLGVLATLSRGGVLALLVAGVLTTMTFGMVRDSETRIGWAVFALIGVVGLALWLGFGTQLASRFEELNDPNAINALDRIQHWSATSPAILDFGLLGSGLGSYHSVHRLYRRNLEERSFEHADNQYFETLVETGWIGLLLLIAAIGLVVWSVILISQKGTSTRTMAIGVAGMFLIIAVAVASITDFGVQLPANCLVLAMFVGIISLHTQSFASRLKKRPSLLKRELPRTFSWGVTLLVVIAVGLSTWHLRTLAAMERLGAVRTLRETYLSLTREQTDRQIAELEPLVTATPTYWGLRRMGELHLHRYRLARFEQVVDRLPASPASLWQSTNLISLHEQIHRFKRMDDQRTIESFVSAPEAKRDIVPAWKWLVASRNRLPFQSDVQLMLGQIQAVFGDSDKSIICLERSMRASPTNADFAYVIGLMYLQAGRTESACETWRMCISLQPKYFEQVMERVHYVANDRWMIEPAVVYQSIVPDDPRLLYAFASQHLASEKYGDMRRVCLERADALLGDGQSISSDPKTVWLEIQIKLGLGEKQAALDKMKWLLRLSPSNIRVVDLRFQMAQLMEELDLIPEAYEEVKWLRKNDFGHVKRYSGLYERLRLRLAKQPGEL